MTISRKEYERLQETERLYNWMLEQLRVARQKAFGPSSERATEGVCKQLSLLFNEAEAIAQELRAAVCPDHHRVANRNMLVEAAVNKTISHCVTNGNLILYFLLIELRFYVFL